MSAPVSESERLRKQLQATLKAERAANALIKLRNSPEVVKALQLRDEGKLNCAEISAAVGKKSGSWWSTTAKKLGEPVLLKRTRRVPATPRKPATALQDLMPDEMLWANYMAAAMAGAMPIETTIAVAARADEALEEHRQRFPRV